ncbi:MAG TPA: response regulator [Saprospiraceae bacterium]|jgi:DNA-binding NtrC family response regulator|nr:response regulator [Saprospiraceae bacterium]MBK8826655.1 response regulator [Saprospiraceae bacterium]MBK8885835.1 response regulator [Saprospiraceae bacterium]MBP9197595.1 response regulator [Saprospiraceae bacterium]HMT54332.1 response regulator [Saprospiraceae bacterium]
MLNTKKIFVVDDDIFTSAIFKQHLQNLGYDDITCFSSGTLCLNHLQERPDIILLDHEMGDLTGFDVLIKIKRFDPNIYVVMVSGQEDMMTAIDSLKYGAFDYIIKGDDTTYKITKVMERIGEIHRLIEQKKNNPFNKLSNLLTSVFF